MTILTVLATVWLALPAHADQASSFNEIRDQVYGKPEAGLNCYPGVGLGDIVKSLLHLGDVLTDRAKWTFGHTGDIKPEGAKPLHPMGVCADAAWDIDQATPYTGLFASGTHSNAIVRFSTGNPVTLYSPGKDRVFGLAIKLYPTSDPNKAVESRNLLFLDQTGLTGDDRPRFLTKENGDLYWQNTAAGGGLPGKLLNEIFKRFDSNPLKRPLKPAADVTMDDRPVANPVWPDVIHLVPDLSNASAIHTGSDFREELLDYGAGEIRFAIVRSDTGARLGTVTVGKPVASEFCDQQLTFHHDSN